VVPRRDWLVALQGRRESNTGKDQSRREKNKVTVNVGGEAEEPKGSFTRGPVS